MVIERPKRQISQGTDTILAELIKAGGRKVCPEIRKRIDSI